MQGRRCQGSWEGSPSWQLAHSFLGSPQLLLQLFQIFDQAHMQFPVEVSSGPAGCLRHGGWRLGRTDALLVCLQSLAAFRPSSCSCQNCGL